DVVLGVPVVLGDLFERAPSSQNSREVGEHVHIAELAARPLDERVVARDDTQVGRDSDVSPTAEPGDELVQLRLVEVDRHHSSAGCSGWRSGSSSNTLQAGEVTLIARVAAVAIADDHA